MKTTKKNSFEGIKKFTGFLNVIFWQKIYLAGIIFVLLSLAISAVLFYNFYFPEPLKSAVVSQMFEVKQSILDDFVSQITSREKAFQDATTKFYPDIFRGPR